jgi:internalin A
MTDGYKEALARIKKAKETQATELDLLNLGLTELPGEIAGLTDLISLNFSFNKVSDLAPITGMENLGILNFSLNYISDLTPIAEMKNLTILHFPRNQVKDISPIIGLYKLMDLDFSNNQVNDISSIALLTELVELDFYQNHVSDISPIAGLTKLTGLSISRNKIMHLPYWVLDFKLPIMLDNAVVFASKHITVLNNPFTEPPSEIVRQGNKAIARYYQNERQRLGEIKIILVGQGTAGKTSVIKRLLDNAFNENEDQTHGIKIRIEDLTPHGQSTKGRFWDFGGQEIMHATHKFFLSERSIYVLVLDSRKDENPDYWLRHIESHGGGERAQAIILFNKSDQNPTFDLDRKALRTKYPFIKDFIPVSAKTGDGIENFRKALFNLIADHPMAESKYPIKWLDVKTALEKEKGDYIGYDAFRKICVRKGVRGADDQEYLLRALNDLGVALNFDNLRGFNTQVLNPLWLTNAVYRIVNAPQVGEERGVLRLSQLGTMLNDPRYGTEKFSFPPEKWSFIVRIMEEFELCYEVRRDAEYIVPERLPAAGEENVPLQTNGKSLRLVIKYPEFMPTSMYPRLMVRTHHLIRGSMRWRTAMQLEESDYFNAQARIMADREDRTISIEVAGKDPRGFLTYLRKELEAIRKSSFSELKYEEYVPIEGKVTVKYETLLAHENRNRKDYFCPELERDFLVADLLDGIEAKEMRSEETRMPVSAFISYAHADEESYAALKEIKKHLMPHVRIGNVTLWDDGAIVAGEDWSQAIWRNFEQADIIICMLSPNFIASEFCFKKELEKALEAHGKGEKLIFPIRLQAFASAGLDIENLQGSPSDWIFDDEKDKLRNDRMVEMANRFAEVLKVVKQRKLEAQKESTGRHSKQIGE